MVHYLNSVKEEYKKTGKKSPLQIIIGANIILFIIFIIGVLFFSKIITLTYFIISLISTSFLFPLLLSEKNNIWLREARNTKTDSVFTFIQQNGIEKGIDIIIEAISLEILREEKKYKILGFISALVTSLAAIIKYIQKSNIDNLFSIMVIAIIAIIVTVLVVYYLFYKPFKRKLFFLENLKEDLYECKIRFEVNSNKNL